MLKILNCTTDILSRYTVFSMAKNFSAFYRDHFATIKC